SPTPLARGANLVSSSMREVKHTSLLDHGHVTASTILGLLLDARQNWSKFTGMVNEVHPRTAPTAGEPLLTMRGIVKHFPGAKALDGVDLEILPGEVHCLLGQNGAGKSTLIKVLAGAHHPDAGTITWRGEPLRIASPVAALRAGIAT